MDQFDGVNTTCFNDLSAIRRALISELAADDTYEEIIRLSSNARVKEVIREIQADEQNHQGRLINLIVELSGGDSAGFAKQFAAGLEDREVSSTE